MASRDFDVCVDNVQKEEKGKKTSNGISGYNPNVNPRNLLP